MTWRTITHHVSTEMFLMFSEIQIKTDVLLKPTAANYLQWSELFRKDIPPETQVHGTLTERSLLGHLSKL